MEKPLVEQFLEETGLKPSYDNSTTKAYIKWLEEKVTKLQLDITSLTEGAVSAINAALMKK